MCVYMHIDASPFFFFFFFSLPFLAVNPSRYADPSLRDALGEEQKRKNTQKTTEDRHTDEEERKKKGLHSHRHCVIHWVG